LAFQAGFALVAFAHTTPRGLALLTLLTLGVITLAETPLLGSLRSYRAFLPFLVGAPLVEAVTLAPPYVVPGDAVGPALASYRVVLLLLVSSAYVRTTTARDSRAAIQRLVPGRAGVVLGAGVAFVLRLVPLLKVELSTVRSAMDARLGDRARVDERVRLVAVTGLRRAFRRADALALALQARCFSWNPTLPPLSFGRVDGVVVGASVALALTALL
jgi:biotin transport system permease protein